jgi:hypothetical protein
MLQIEDNFKNQNLKKSGSFAEIQKLKSMVSHLEKKNNLIIKKLENESPEKMFPNSPKFQSQINTSEYYDQGRTSLIDQSRHIRMPLSPTSALNNTINRSPEPRVDARKELDTLKNELSNIKFTNTTLTNENLRLKKDLEVVQLKHDETRAQLDTFKNEHIRLMEDYKKLKKAFEIEKKNVRDLEKLNTEFEKALKNKDNEIGNLRAQSGKKTVDMKNQIERVITDFTHIMDTKYKKIDALLEKKEHELDGFRDVLTEKLRGLERTITDTQEDYDTNKDYSSHPEGTLNTVENTGPDDERSNRNNLQIFLEAREEELVPDSRVM